MKLHPAAELFPTTSAEDFAALKADIDANGQCEPVTVYKGLLIDGHHRARACKELGIQLQLGELDEEDDPYSHVLSMNLHRRHLTTSQRSVIAAKMANLKSGQRKPAESNGSAQSLEDAATILNVGRQSVCVLDDSVTKTAIKMNKEQSERFRFSLRSMLVLVTLLALGAGAWIAYEDYEIQQLVALRQQGVIVIMRDDTPNWLKSVGIELSRYCSLTTVELYVTPLGTEAIVGNGNKRIPNEAALEQLLRQASTARDHGAADIHLIQLDDFDDEWMKFANDNSSSCIGENQDRYKARLKANQESGANINP